MVNIDQQIDLIAALNRLSPRQRKVVILWAAGYTHKEIGKQLGISANTVQTHFHRGVVILRSSIPFNSEDST